MKRNTLSYSFKVIFFLWKWNTIVMLAFINRSSSILQPGHIILSSGMYLSRIYVIVLAIGLVSYYLLILLFLYSTSVIGIFITSHRYTTKFYYTCTLIIFMTTCMSALFCFVFCWEIMHLMRNHAFNMNELFCFVFFWESCI